MQKELLRKNNYSLTYVNMPRRMLNISSWFFVMLFTLAEIVLTMYVRSNMGVLELDRIAIDIPIPPYITVIAFPFSAVYLYYALIRVISGVFCESKRKNIKLRFIEEIKMPACVCTEALKPYQVIMTYALSMLLIFLLFAVLILTGGPTFSLMAFFCAILIAPDASLLLYLLYVLCIFPLKRRKRPDYILVQDHLSSIILFKR